QAFEAHRVEELAIVGIRHISRRRLDAPILVSDPQARRVENRLPSSDANPYLALAASLASGLLWIMNEIEPTAPTEDSAN
ncbi:hypothetical protein ACC782_38480, partial [Rhizobium ruizarguesonis]